MNGIKKAVYFGDLHAPYQDEYAVSILCQIVTDEKPDYLINIGDGGDFESLSRFNKAYPRKREGKRVIKDLMAMIDLENEIYLTAPDGCDIRKHTGNHEWHLERWADENPEVEGIIETLMDSSSIKMIPHAKFTNIGKLLSHHGDRKGYQSVHHAKQWAMIGRSIVYGHHHSVQTFPHETLDRHAEPDRHRAFAIGCLCDLNRDWMDNQRKLWQQSFGLVYFWDDGNFNFYNVDIIDKRAVWNGKLYKG